MDDFAKVSIHAPARGATTNALETGMFAMFQSTRPRGARQNTRNLNRYGKSFNPRARAGRDAHRLTG